MNVDDQKDSQIHTPQLRDLEEVEKKDLLELDVDLISDV